MGNIDIIATKEREDRFGFEGPRADVADAERRLAILLDLNALFPHDSIVASGYSSAIKSEPDSSAYKKAYSLLGLSLGLMPSSAFLIRLIADKGLGSGELWLLLLFALVVLGSTVTGYFTGKIVGSIVAEIERFSWPLMIASLPFIGVTWGIIAGGAGGIFIFLFGAIPGAVIGGAVGAFALTIFTILHRMLSEEGELSGGKLPPLAIGVSALAASIILGFPIS